MSNQSNSNTTSSGTSVIGLLGVLFVGLKLTGFIHWPWVWVLAPFWVPLALALALLLVAGIIITITKGITK